jgi:RNA polymerase sigma factor (sigma-70 family)
MGSFEAWFRELLPVARRVAARLAVDDPDDVVAEAFARAYVRWNQVEALPYRDAWLLRVLTNLGFDRARRAHRRSPAPVIAAAEDDVATRVVVRQAIGGLPRRQREAISLRYLSDMSEHDVSRALGISPNSVKRHLERGRSTLRTRLADGWDDDDG